MRRLVIAAAAALGIAVAGGAIAAAAAGDAPQELSVSLAGGRPQIERQSRYDSRTPVEVSVVAPRAGAVTLAGTSPDGENLQVPLARSPDGLFSGAVRFPTPGTWTLALEAGRAGVASFPLQVGYGFPGESALVAAAAALCVAGGVGMLVRGARPRRI